jgi:hypothetical protein
MNQNIDTNGNDFEVKPESSGKGTLILTEREQEFATHIGYQVDCGRDGIGINLGLYFPEELAKDGILKPNGVNVFYPERNGLSIQRLSNVELIFPNGITRMNQTETLYGFASWLTVRNQPVTLSARHGAAVVAELINVFSKENNLPAIRENWTDYLVGMGKHEEIVQDRPEETLLEKLDGKLDQILGKLKSMRSEAFDLESHIED